MNKSILFLTLLGLACGPMTTAAPPAEASSEGDGTVGLAPDVCRAAGWKTVHCVKSPTSSRWYVGSPVSAVSYSESLVVVTLPITGQKLCMSTGTRACGSHAYDVCDDRDVNYFYCGSTASHLVEGYFKR